MVSQWHNSSALTFYCALIFSTHLLSFTTKVAYATLDYRIAGFYRVDFIFAFNFFRRN